MTKMDTNIDPMTFQLEADRIEWVQTKLLELNYTGGGPVDGDLNLKTQGAILNFRNRNGLPLVPYIDDLLLNMMRMAPAIEMPVEQTLAQPQDIAPKVAAVQQTLWAKFWAKMLGIPSVITAIITGVANNFDDATTMLQPLRAFLEGYLTQLNPLYIVLGTSIVTSLVAGAIWWNSGNAMNALTDAYRRGTLRNDNTIGKESGT